MANVSGYGYYPNTPVNVTWQVGGQTIGSANSDENGSFVLPVTIPASALPGTYTVLGATNEFTLYASAKFVVQ